MEVESETNAYVIQTVDINELNATENDGKIVIENSPIIICSENGVQAHYVPYCMENGQITLRKLEDEEIERLTDSSKIIENEDQSEIKQQEPETIMKVQETTNTTQTTQKHKQTVLNSSQNLPKKKLSYDTVLKPCSLPSHRGGIKGLIRYGRKHLIVDEQIMISPREFKQQLNNSDDIIARPEVAPCTKQQMRHMLTGITRLFAYPAHKMPHNKLLQLYVANCTSKEQPNAEKIHDMELLPLGYQTSIDPSTIKRISRKRKNPDAEEYMRKQQEAEGKEENEETKILVEAAKSANGDHKYSKKITENIESPIVYTVTEAEEEYPKKITEDIETPIVYTVTEEEEYSKQITENLDTPIVYTITEEEDEVSEVEAPFYTVEIKEGSDQNAQKVITLNLDEFEMKTSNVYTEDKSPVYTVEIENHEEEGEEEGEDIITLNCVNDDAENEILGVEPDEEQIVIIQGIDENGECTEITQNNLEVLLQAAANTENNENQFMMYNNGELNNENRIFIVQREEIKDILTTESEMILS